MKNKVWKGVCFTALSVAFALSSLTACRSGDDAEEGATASSVWSTYATAKVTRNVKENVPYEKLDASINVQMMKNETEGAQLVVTAGEDVRSYSLTVSELLDGKGNAIPKDSISVYHQKYMQVVHEWNTLNPSYQAGDYLPDMLLPLETAIEYKENSIKKGENQGITVEIKTTSETVPGTYTGTFVLDLDGTKQEIPVTVEVWDIEYEGRREFQSCFLIYRNSLVRGEYEASDELVDRYIEFLMDYKMNAYVIKDSYSVAELVEESVRLFEDNNFNSICIPKSLQEGYTATCGMAGEIVDYIVEMTRASTEEAPYVKYLYLYPTHFDEADIWEEKYTDVMNVFKAGGEWDKTLARALAEVKETKEYAAFSAEFKAQVDEAILNIPAVFTNVNTREDWIKELSATFCPYLNLLGDDATLQKYQQYSQDNGNGDLWVYTCVGPTYPNPTFHIDDYNLGTRVSGWMEKKFGVDGYLYWAVNMYEAVNSDQWRDVNAYETSERASYCGGDGYLMYPGAYYGSEYPFGSIRLSAWRDSMDDYDMLTVYERLLEEKAAAYGTTVRFEEYVNDLYDSLFTGTHYYTDDSLVYAAREELAARILALQSDDGIMIDNGRDVATLYTAKATLTVNGVQQTGTPAGTGYCYPIAKTDAVQTVTVASDSATYRYNVSGTGLVASFAEAPTGVKVTENSEVSYADGKANVKIVSAYKSADGTIDGATMRFSPYVQFSVNGMQGATDLRFSMENTGATDIEVTVKLMKEDGVSLTAGTAYVKVGASRDVRIALDSSFFTDSILEDVVSVRLTFKNMNSDNSALSEDREFALGDIWFERSR